MARLLRLAGFVVCASIVSVMVSVVADAQGRAVPRPPVRHQTAVGVRGHVFIGGYFYDPFFGPYPWWVRTAYPYWYFPIYDQRAEIRLQVTPKEAAVYVDGFYAGIVDDFNGFFEGLPLPPGGHRIVLYLEGYRTVHQGVYLQPASTLKLRETMERLPGDAQSEPPPIAPAVPTPPPGTFSMPRTPAQPVIALPVVPGADSVIAIGFGALELHVLPATSEITVDGERWLSSEEGHLFIQLPAGLHRIEVNKPGYRRFATEIQVRDGVTVPLNVSLLTMTTP